MEKKRHDSDEYESVVAPGKKDTARETSATVNDDVHVLATLTDTWEGPLCHRFVALPLCYRLLHNTVGYEYSFILHAYSTV